jgi:predicted nucleic acid-binding protein
MRSTCARSITISTGWGGPDAAIEVLADLRRLGVVENTRMNADFWQDAAILKSVHRRISIADCFAVALTWQPGATLIASDRREFEPLTEKRVCSVRFIR